MKLSKFRYKLPPELIAQHPSANRDECRLMVVDRKTGTIEHKVFKDVIDYFDEKDVFVFNDTKVFPARLYGNKEKTGAEIEVFLLRELNRDLRIWDVLVDPARKIRIGNKLYFGEDDSLVAEVIEIPPLVDGRCVSCSTENTMSLRSCCMAWARLRCRVRLHVKWSRKTKNVIRRSLPAMKELLLPRQPVCILVVS